MQTMDSLNIVKKYFSDLKDIGNQLFKVESPYLQSQSGSERSFKFMPYDLKQVELNISLQNYENLQDIITDLGFKLLISENVTFVDGESNNMKEEPPTIDIGQLNVIEAIDICYNMKLCEGIERRNQPIDVIELSYEIKNFLKLPDEFFNEFPSKPLETPIGNSVKNLPYYGIVQENKVYYTFYNIFKDNITPINSYPANIKLSEDIKIEGILEALIRKFSSFSTSPRFQIYMEYRTIKNLRNKVLMRKGKPLSFSLLTKQEATWALESGMFRNLEEKLQFEQGMDISNLNESVNKLSLECENLVREWKKIKLF
jgi:hypothetical protein